MFDKYILGSKEVISIFVTILTNTNQKYDCHKTISESFRVESDYIILSLKATLAGQWSDPQGEGQTIGQKTSTRCGPQVSFLNLFFFCFSFDMSSNPDMAPLIESPPDREEQSIVWESRVIL